MGRAAGCGRRGGGKGAAGGPGARPPDTAPATPQPPPGRWCMGAGGENKFFVGGFFTLFFAITTIHCCFIAPLVSLLTIFISGQP